VPLPVTGHTIDILNKCDEKLRTSLVTPHATPQHDNLLPGSYVSMQQVGFVIDGNIDLNAAAKYFEEVRLFDIYDVVHIQGTTTNGSTYNIVLERPKPNNK
jgi:hypothetical protein